jgi:hypothetical protein
MHRIRIGFLIPKISSKFLRESGKPSIKQVLTPSFVAVPDQPHELPGGVQRKGPRSACQFQTSFFRRAIAFPVVAAVAAGH